MPSNTNYIATKYADLDQSFLSGAGQGVALNCIANSANNLDLALSDDMIITGIQVVASSVTNGDYAEMRVLAGGVTIAQPLPGPWYLSSNFADFTFPFPIKVPAGTTLRVIVHTQLLSAPFVAVNFKLWKVLS